MTGTKTGLEHAVELLSSGDLEGGAARLEQLLEQEPGDPDVTGHLAFTRLQLRQWRGARELYERLASLDPRRMGARELYYQAWAAAAGGNLRRAVELCGEAVRRDPSDADPAELGSICALRLGDPAAGCDLLGQSKAFVPIPLRWVVSFFADCGPGRLPRMESPAGAVGRGVEGVARLLAAAGRGRLAQRTDRALWRLWPFHPAWRSGQVRTDEQRVDEQAIEAYWRVISAMIDELLQLPLIPLGSTFSAPIRTWDAVSLYTWFRDHRPGRAMHVGAHLGVSACLCALAMRDAGGTRPGAIHTVDPYLIDPHLDPPRICRAMASSLGIEETVTIHEGFFNHVLPSPPALARAASPRPPARVIGRQLLEELGPLDCFFIDGDHSPMGVVADVLLSLEWLAPGGTLLLHDVRRINGVRKGIETFFYDDEIGPLLEYGELRPSGPDGIGVVTMREEKPAPTRTR